VPVITLLVTSLTSLTSTWSWVCPFSNFFPPLALSVVTIVSLDSINCHLSLSILIANLFTPSAINFLGSWTILSDHEFHCVLPCTHWCAQRAREQPLTAANSRTPLSNIPLNRRVAQSPSHRSTPQWNLESGLADRHDLVVATIAPPFAFIFPSRFGSIHLDSSHPSDHRCFWRRMVKSARGRSRDLRPSGRVMPLNQVRKGNFI
jgi:hypothetical protein